ncbi:MAG: hypothetical protein LBD58_03095 [Treponema sp.]|nr:hypothetical protein [Treponema sp.]
MWKNTAVAIFIAGLTLSSCELFDIKTPGIGIDTLNAIAYGDGVWVIGSISGAIAWSSDGVRWTAAGGSPFGADAIHEIIYGNDRFAAVGGGGKTAYSLNGVDWERGGDSTFGNYIKDIAYGGGKFVAVGEYGKVAYSEDGCATWNEAYSAVFASSCINGITYGGGKFVAVGEYGKIAWSENGISWTAAGYSSYSFMINDVAYSGDKFVAVGNAKTTILTGKIIHSADGIQWTDAGDTSFISDPTSQKGSFILKAAYGNGIFIAAGCDNVIYDKYEVTGKMSYSADGAHWTAVNDTTFGKNSVEGIAYGGGKFVAVGVNSAIAYSADGVNWTAVSNPFSAVAPSTPQPAATNLQRAAGGAR